MPKIKEITITISYSEMNNGYMYEIYKGIPDDIEEILENNLDGGLCTTTMKNAIDMACSQAKDLIH